MPTILQRDDRLKQDWRSLTDREKKRLLAGAVTTNASNAASTNNSTSNWTKGAREGTSSSCSSSGDGGRPVVMLSPAGQMQWLLHLRRERSERRRFRGEDAVSGEMGRRVQRTERP